MRWSVITIFPHLVQSFCAESLLSRAQSCGIVEISTCNPRDFAEPPHFKVDDTPYGGGAGMVMGAPPLLAAIGKERTRLDEPNNPARVILLSPSGASFNQTVARRLSKQRSIILVCGRYEGVDQRVIDTAVDEELSIGDFVLMGGEAAALCIIEAVSRLVPGVLGNQASPTEESFDDTGLLEAPCYTKPAELPCGKVPQVLLSGNHKLVEEWRRQQRLERTAARRPDLLACREDSTHHTSSAKR